MPGFVPDTSEFWLLGVGFGVAGTLAGDNLAGTSLAFTRAEGDYQLTTPVPFSYLTPGYTGPRLSTP